jgi:hypothetical protein
MSRNIRLLHEISQHECLLRDKEATLAKENAEIQAAIQELKASAKGGKITAKLQSKLDYLSLRAEAYEKQCNDLISEKDKHLDLVNKDLRGTFERMHGLLAYGITNGGVSKDCELLFGSLGDFLGAKTDSDRRSAEKAINLCLEHGSLGKEAEPADDENQRILNRFNQMPDGEERTAFFLKHRIKRAAAHDANLNQNPTND